MANISGGLAGLSLLTGADAFSAFSAAAMPAVETKAQRRAHAQFTTAETTPLWKLPPSTTPVSQQVAGIKAMKTIIDKPTQTGAALPTDVQTVFTAYKALDRLQMLADSAAKDTTSSAERALLQKAFAKGLTDLKGYLATAPSDLVQLSYARSAREVKTVAVAAPATLTTPTIAGKGVRETRDGALAGVTGDEVLKITIAGGPGASDIFTVDLSSGPQPPTLDSVADQVNAAIRAVPRKDADGNTVLDTEGNPVPRWDVSMEPTKQGEKWGLTLKRAGFETISIDEVGAPDAIMIAAGVTGSDATRPEPTKTQIIRLDDPTGALTRTNLGTISATDRIATKKSALAADEDKTGKLTAQTIGAAVSANGIVTDAQGNSYVVGSTVGDVKGNRSNGSDDLMLTKLDSEGQVVWQRNLGAASSAKGAAVTIAPDGGIVVAGTVTGNFEGANSDGDMMVARYDALGNESFSTLVRAVGVESASAVAVGADGSIYVGGRSETGAGDALITRLDGAGVFKEQRVIAGAGSDSVRSLAISGDGELLALTSEGGEAVVRKLDASALSTDLGQVNLGRADARALTVAADGRIAVAGATEAALGGAQANAPSGGLDGFVAQIDAGLSGARVTYLGTGASDQADSVAFMGDDLYVGGRTAGALSGDKTGDTDAFVARVDAASGSVASIRQYGTIGAKSEAVQISAIQGGDSVLGKLGLHRGTLTPTDSTTLEAQTSLRTGDEFSIRVNDGALRKITIDEGETLTSLADKIRKFAGTNVASITTPFKDDGRALSIMMKPGQEIQFVAGAAGKDALTKLGLDAKRISAPATLAKDAPTVRPGGAFGLDLDDALQLDTKGDAKIALARIKQAVSFSQSAYRSLYWDDTKAKLADSSGKKGRTGGSTAIETAQLANYKAALSRLSSPNTSYGF